MPYQPNDTLLNKYRIEALIGRGAFAEVYRVTHLTLNVTRALKIFNRAHPGVGSTEFSEFLGRFQLEAQLGAKLNTQTQHPNLVQVYDFQQLDDLLLLEVEYASGGNLADRMERAKTSEELIPIDEVLGIATDIARGLAAIHALDVVHRDLKPSNILLDRDGRAKVADLGLAQIPGGPSMRSRLSEPLPHPGTPGYMSPEQQNLRDYLSPRSDVFALGLILFEMFTGRFYRNVRPGTRVGKLRSDVPRWLDNLIARLLAPDPDGRPWDGAEVLGLLENKGQKTQSQNFEPEVAPTDQSQDRSDEDKKHGFSVSKYMIWGCGGLLLAILGIIVFVWLLGGFPGGGKATPTPFAASNAPSVGDENSSPAANTSTIPPMISAPTQAQPTKTTTPIPTKTATGVPSSTPLSEFDAGDTRISTKDGMTMVYVPEGQFLMGNNTGDANEAPIHQVFLDAYWIDRTEVTNAMYAQCVHDGFCNLPATTSSYSRDSYYGNPTYADYPVMHVSWGDAYAYCSWAERRLPTEAEWEKAARGDDGRVYPWGNSSPGPNLLNWNGNIGDTTEVGSYPAGASPYGVLDMAGNLWEWVEDWYSDTYYARSPASNPPGPTSGTARILRGGSCLGKDYFARTTNRWFDIFEAGNKFGFRCAMDARP